VRDAHTTPASRLGVVTDPSMGSLQAELVEAAVAAARRMGLETRTVSAGSPVADLTWLLGIGTEQPYSRVMETAGQADGPFRIAWIGEPLLAPGDRGSGILSRVSRSRAVAGMRLPPALRGIVLPGPLGRARSRVRYDKELARNTRRIPSLAAITDRIVVTSRDQQAILARNGSDSMVVPFGYEPAVHGALASPALSRDIDLLSLGHHGALGGLRRYEYLASPASEEPHLLTAEGVWGPERNALLRRTRVVLNVQRVPGTFIGLRLVLSLAAGAAVVTEPMTDPHPFVPGVHYVEAPLDRLMDESRALLSDEPRRRRIVTAGQEMMRRELAMTVSLARVLEPADQVMGDQVMGATAG
jgi:hypothetical protein